jgi:UDPglucose 6-dehydrogenase
MRNAPSIDIINSLLNEGAVIKCFDPQAMPKARRILKNVRFCKNPYDAAKGSDALLILTEWNEFKELYFSRIKKTMKQPIVLDGRNMYDPIKMKKLGFKYICVGR